MKCVVLAEVWNFEFVPCQRPPSEKSDSVSSSSRKGSFSMSPRLTTTDGQIFEIDENHFQVHPDDVRHNQSTKFTERLTVLARSLPLHALLNNSHEMVAESKWDKQRDWRGRTKVSAASEFATDLYEYGKVIAKVEFVPSEGDLNY